MTDITRHNANGPIESASMRKAIDHVNAATRAHRDMLTRLETGRWAPPGEQHDLSRSARSLDQDIAEAESVLIVLLQNAGRLGAHYGQETSG